MPEPSAVRRYTESFASDIPNAAILLALVLEPATRDFALVNLGVQLVLFVLVACIPAYRTKIMGAVDVAWPWGLVAVGVLTLVFSDTGSALTIAVAAAYVVVGGRMGIWGFRLIWGGGVLSEDLPRYRYQRRRWQHAGYRSETFPMQHEILGQGFANAAILALPAMLVVARDGAGLGAVEIAALCVFAVCWALESVADSQKARFGARSRREGVKRTCDVGLWRYSRHPNYFFQWMQWNALIVVALPSLIDLYGEIGTGAWIVEAVGLVGISAVMYHVLTTYTGAKPAEHFSRRSRPDYAAYQASTNRFFPGPSRRSANSAAA